MTTTARDAATDRLITVCAECKCASCWHGEFMCERAKFASLESLPESELRRLNREHPDHYSVTKIREVYGEQDG